MSNFTGIIGPALKQTFVDAISALLEDAALTRPCRLKYQGTEQQLCSNCLYDSMNQRSANVYRPGGPIPFGQGEVCPYCHGAGGVYENGFDNVYLAVLWDYKNWYNFDFNGRSPAGMVQTLCTVELLSKIKRASEIVIDTALEPDVVNLFVRDGEPEPAGLGGSDFIFTMWKRA